MAIIGMSVSLHLLSAYKQPLLGIFNVPSTEEFSEFFKGGTNMDNQQYVLVEKEVLENLITTIQEMKERLNDIEHNTQVGIELIGAVAEKFGVA